MTTNNKETTQRRVALVTGGARGIGFGVAKELARDNFDLAVCGLRDPSAAAPAMAELRQLGAETLYVRADVSAAAARRRLLDALREKFGRLNVLVNNAGVAPKVRADILEATEDSFDWVLKVNLQGPYFLTQECARWMIEQKKADPDWRGCVINISSVSATEASVNRGEYCISKAGLSMATQLWASRLGEFDIPVFEIRPGIIRTDMTASVQAKYDALIAEGLLVQARWGMAEEVGKAAAVLVRGDLSYSTGQVLMVDGGLTLRRL
ncbi:MAG TPA: 3-ketoacyl-ACP reductase [Verrucomicrobiae bacterium]|jgi:NAD(P)-dependent dehydrogenase (short-subunit alcohol dehydrogenase family)|nr:3-ketoacyl-ACP reductase [Verrucomicrobiae bacterium]